MLFIIAREKGRGKREEKGVRVEGSGFGFLVRNLSV